MLLLVMRWVGTVLSSNDQPLIAASDTFAGPASSIDNNNYIYICFAIISGSGMCGASQLPLDRLVLSIKSMVFTVQVGSGILHHPQLATLNSVQKRTRQL